MSPKEAKAPISAPRPTVEISRDFDFPRETVFHMFTDAKKCAQFWGPRGAVKHLFELDPRPGGLLRIHDGDAERVIGKTTGTITEIVPPELLAFRSATAVSDGAAPWEVLQTLRFQALGARRTRLTIQVQILATGSWEGDEASLGEGYKGGWGETLDMLRNHLH